MITILSSLADWLGSFLIVSVFEPKMRELTQGEINALKQQRDSDLSELEKIAV